MCGTLLVILSITNGSTQYLGEEGSNCQLKAAIACANPWNLEVSNNALKRTFVGHNLYSKVLGSKSYPAG